MGGFTPNIYSGYYNLVENIANVSGQTVNINATSIVDFIFMYAFLFSFLGAILYSVTSMVNIDVGSVIINKNVSVVLNAYLGICGAVSFFVWYNMVNPIFGITILNPNVVKSNISS